MGLRIKEYPMGPLSENTYFIQDEASGKSAVVDPGYIGEDIVAAINDTEGLEYILLTHGHFDHFTAAEEYKKLYPDALLTAPEYEKYLLGKPLGYEAVYYGAKDKCCRLQINIHQMVTH